MTAPKNIVVLRALGGIGDFLTAVPALARLRAGYTKARITYIGLPTIEGLACRYPGLIDRFVAFPGFPGIPELPFEARRLYSFLEDWRSGPQADLVIQMHGSGSVSNVFAALLGGKRLAGYFIPGLWRPNEIDYSPFPDEKSEESRWDGLVERLGCPAADIPSFPVGDEEQVSLGHAVGDVLCSPYAVVHAGASAPARRWPPAFFARVADYLADLGIAVVLTGTEAERDLVAKVMRTMRRSAIDLTGRTTLGQAAALIDGALLTITNDTGTSHLARAMGASSIVLFIASDPARWAPADAWRHIAVGTGVPDAPIGRLRVQAQPSFPEVEDVLEAIDRHVMAVAA